MTPLLLSSSKFEAFHSLKNVLCIIKQNYLNKKMLPSQKKKIKNPRSRVHLAQDQQNLFVNESLGSNTINRWPHWGRPDNTKMDEFLEKFQMALDPPSPPYFWKEKNIAYCWRSVNICVAPIKEKIAIWFFSKWITSNPPFSNIPKIHLFW